MGHDLTERRDRVAAVVQARMGSSRLPGKALAPLGEHTALALVLRRLADASELDAITVATSTDPADDAIVRHCADLDVPVIRGPLDDVLARFRIAADALGAAAVVRITADCPLIEPDLVDLVVARWRQAGGDYVSNTLDPRSFPDGLDVEVVSTPALHAAFREARAQGDREHVTSYVRDNPTRFAIAGVWLDPCLGDLRMTLDTPADLEHLERLVRQLGPDARLPSILAALGHAGQHAIRYEP